MTYVVFNIDTTSLPNYSRLLTAMVGREGDALCVLGSWDSLSTSFRPTAIV